MSKSGYVQICSLGGSGMSKLVHVRLVLPGRWSMRGIADATKALVAEVNAILRENNPQTLRQVHYQVFESRERRKLQKRQSML